MSCPFSGGQRSEGMEAVPLRTVRGFVRTAICRPFFNYIQPVSNLREIRYRKHMLVLEKEKKMLLRSSRCGSTGSAASLQHRGAGLIPGPAQWLKDPVLPQLQCRSQRQLRSDPWLANSVGRRAAEKEKKRCFLKSKEGKELCGGRRMAHALHFRRRPPSASAAGRAPPLTFFGAGP